MKKIEAIIRPHKFTDVKTALAGIGIKTLTISDVKGISRQKGHKEIYRGSEFHVDLNYKIKIEIIIPDDKLSPVVDAIAGAAKTGHVGDGKIFISTIDESIRIGAGNPGDIAFS